MKHITTYLPWEKKAIWALTLRFTIIGLATAFLFFLVAVATIFFGYGIYVPKSLEVVLVLVPWALILVYGTITSYHNGVLDEFAYVMGEEALENHKDAPHKNRLANWERADIRRLTIKQIIFATIGTLALVGAGKIWVDFGYQAIHPILLFMLWVFICITQISDTYHEGVIAQRVKLRGRRDADRRIGPRRAHEEKPRGEKTAAPG